MNPVCAQWFPLSFHKFDKGGRPVFWQRFGVFDVAGVYQHCGPEPIRRHSLRAQELSTYLLRTIVPEGAAPIDRLTIIDLGGLGWNQFHKPGLAVLKQIIGDNANHYPETSWKVLMVNVPPIFDIFWSVVKPWVPAHALAKITIVSKEKSFAALSELIDPVDIPDWIEGGQCHCTPQCTSNGGVLDAKDTHELVEISARSQHVQVLQAASGERVLWHFFTQANDIGFGINYVNGTEKTPVVDLVRYDNSNVEAVHGSVVAEREGTYELVWDNSYSLLRGKSVHLSVKIHPFEA